MATNNPTAARDAVVAALCAARGDRQEAALALRASGHLPPPGPKCDRAVVTLYEIIADLPEGEEILTLYPSPSRRVDGVDYVPEPVVKPKPPAVVKAKTRSTPDALRMTRARGKRTRAACAALAGLKDESSVRNVEKRGFALGGRLLAWVEQQEANQ
jgi:hypothetical protein